MKKILITGITGFIGFHLAKHLCHEYEIHGVDICKPSNNDIFSQRLALISSLIHYHHADIRNYEEISSVVKKIKPHAIVHLAACTGIANSTLYPQLYFDTNVKGFHNMLELCKELGINNLFYASSSSVYNEKEATVFKEENVADKQLSFYGITKRMDELMAAYYAKKNGLTCVGMRFFTVYGSWVRHDMAAWKFMNSLYNKKPVVLYNNGNVFRDFTHVFDIVESISLLIKKQLSGTRGNAHTVFNIGNGEPVSVKEYLIAIAENLRLQPEIIYKPLPDNELEYTHADTSKLYSEINYKPLISLKKGVKEMTDWFIQYQKL